jgi:hypothetical protein
VKCGPGLKDVGSRVVFTRETNMLRTYRAILGLAEAHGLGDRESDMDALQLSHALATSKLELISPYILRRISWAAHTHGIRERKGLHRDALPGL